MVQKLEATKSGGGSIKIGTTGTIGSLMTRELDLIKSAPQTLVSCRHKPQTVPVSVSCNCAMPKRLQMRKSLDEASTSGGSNSMNGRSPQNAQKRKCNLKNTNRVPMLGSDNIALERTPSREKTDKKVNIVEIVDIKCGNPDRAWASPLTNRLKKIGFSKLSESMI
ncbi:hypothetical protein SLEP1_g26437 [Rubroshorea leprosula]|uniref:Uncharacterized protein n=1 Tax=Rubroshorea leprosula TaxID=152421 RepID=A0AAV5JM29_9ROSI|nr:hypothetical protein SLEP1_g26437 [Rubroshorea leprosula]